MVLKPQAGAVSLTVPVQVSVAVPLAPSVVTGLPLWLHGVDVVVPPGNGTVFVTARLMTVLPGSRFVTENVHEKALTGGTRSGGEVFETERPVVFWHLKILTELADPPDIGRSVAASVPG